MARKGFVAMLPRLLAVSVISGFVLAIWGLINSTIISGLGAYGAPAALFFAAASLTWAMAFRRGKENFLDSLNMVLMVSGVHLLLAAVGVPLVGFVLDSSLVGLAAVLSSVWIGEAIASNVLPRGM